MIAVRQSVLIITRNLPPLRGGMERLNRHMAIELSREYAVVVIGPYGCRSELPADIVVYECKSSSLAGFMAIALIKAFGTALRIRPAWIVAGSGLTAPFTWMAARLTRARAAVYVHGLDLIVDNPVYRSIWLPFVRRCDLCVANSANTASLAVAAHVPAHRIEVVNPGVEWPTPTIDSTEIVEFKERHRLLNSRVLLSVGRMTERKGLLEFVQNCLTAIINAYPDLVLLVVGDEAPDALAGNASGMTERIRQAADRLGLADKIRFIGVQSERELALAYRAADVHIFPVKPVRGDIEGFGMVAIEAAAHGTPTVAFDVGGVADAVADGISGWLVRSADYAAFAGKVADLLGPMNEGHQTEVRRFAASFAWPRFGRELRAAFVRSETRG